MALKGDEVRTSLNRFAAYWSQCRRSERSEVRARLAELHGRVSSGELPYAPLGPPAPADGLGRGAQ